jgi:hypothetical protein
VLVLEEKKGVKLVLIIVSQGVVRFEKKKYGHHRGGQGYNLRGAILKNKVRLIFSAPIYH